MVISSGHQTLEFPAFSQSIVRKIKLLSCLTYQRLSFVVCAIDGWTGGGKSRQGGYASHQVFSVLRHNYPHVHFSYCLDDDVTHGRSVFSGPRFNLYLIDGRDHCLALTTDAEIATGILVAEVGDNEDDE